MAATTEQPASTMTSSSLAATTERKFGGSEVIARAVEFSQRTAGARVYLVDADNSSPALIALSHSAELATSFIIAVVRVGVEPATVAAVAGATPAHFCVYRVAPAVSGAVDCAIAIFATLLAERLPPPVRITLVSNDRFVQAVAAMLPACCSTEVMRTADVWKAHAPHMIVDPPHVQTQAQSAAEPGPETSARRTALSELTDGEVAALFDYHARRQGISHAAWCAYARVSESKVDKFRANAHPSSQKVRRCMIRWIADVVPTSQPVVSHRPVNAHTVYGTFDARPAASEPNRTTVSGVTAPVAPSATDAHSITPPAVVADAPVSAPVPVGQPERPTAGVQAVVTDEHRRPSTASTRHRVGSASPMPANVQELIDFYHRTWGASHNSFCARYSVDQSNFSKFRRGIKPSPVCANAIVRWKEDFERIQQQQKR